MASQQNISQSQPATPHPLQAGTSETIQFLTFSVAGQEYGINIMDVHEVKCWSEPTRLPNAPSHIRGVLNLRGTIIPIHDIAERFVHQQTVAEAMHVIIITQWQGRMAGMLVDTVNDILTVQRQQIQPIPDQDNSNDNHYVSGIITNNERMVAMIHLPALMDHDTHPATNTQAA